MHRRPLLAMLGLVAVVMSLTAPAVRAQSFAIDRPAAVRLGTCADLGEVVATLAHVVLTPGDPQGETGATPVEQSGTVVPYQLTDFLATAHSVVVEQSPASTTLVACGEVGGAVNPDGTLGIGMRSMNDSGLSGVTYFTPIDMFENMLVTILLVSDGSGTEPAGLSGGSDVQSASGANGAVDGPGRSSSE
jgi:hypothetical protein